MNDIPEDFAKSLELIKNLLTARAPSKNGSINYPLLKLAFEGLDEVADFLLTANVKDIADLGHWCKVKKIESNPSYAKPKDMS